MINLNYPYIVKVHQNRYSVISDHPDYPLFRKRGTFHAAEYDSNGDAVFVFGFKTEEDAAVFKIRFL